jgi:hypothetical protein
MMMDFFRSFKKAFNDVILSRRAIRNMNTLYPDATQEELAAADNVCIICREEMIAGKYKTFSLYFSSTNFIKLFSKHF